MKPKCVAVALSGGMDSTALWHATARMAAAMGGLEVVAFHVHHGLQPHADSWVVHLQHQARRWAARGLPVSLQCTRLLGKPQAGESIEAWARRERYAALADMARSREVNVVLLAHHRRDQAETYLLQALRGAGPAGLSAMPREALRGGITWMRPWLEQPREAIQSYVRRHRLGFVDDPSNADTRFARNRLRQAVWPALSGAFDNAEASLSASARRAQEAAACLIELARMDMQSVCADQGRLVLARWLALSVSRRNNLMRAWLAAASSEAVPETLVQRLHEQLPAATSARWPLGRGQLRLHGGQLRFEADAAGSAYAAAKPIGQVTPIDLSRVGWTAVPAWGGAFELRSVPCNGLAPQQLQDCELRTRSGGERFQNAPNSTPRSLKKQYQSAGVPAWERNGPLLYSKGELLYVPGLGIDARRLAAPGTPMWSLHWVSDGSVRLCNA